MTMSELYNKIGADYRDVQQRLGSDMVIERFIRRFAGDSTYYRLKEAYDSGDEIAVYNEACAFAEVCGSLSLDKLTETLRVIIEAYRSDIEIRSEFHVNDLFETLSEQYHTVIAEIKNAIDGG